MREVKDEVEELHFLSLASKFFYFEKYCTQHTKYHKGALFMCSHKKILKGIKIAFLWISVLKMNGIVKPTDIEAHGSTYKRALICNHFNFVPVNNL